jgi:hypothetical protein
MGHTAPDKGTTMTSNDPAIITDGVWTGWEHDDAARAAEWQIRCYAYAPLPSDGFDAAGVLTAWEDFTRTGTLPEIAHLARDADRFEQTRPGRRDAEWPWVLRLRAVPIPWADDPADDCRASTSGPMWGVRLLGGSVGTGRTDCDGLLLDGEWRGWTYGAAAAWSAAFFATDHDLRGPWWNARLWQHERARFQESGALPRMWTWAAVVARLEADGWTARSWETVRSTRQRRTAVV